MKELEDIIPTLNEMGIEAEFVNFDEQSHFSRTVEFTIYDMTYRIIWHINVSYLYFGTSARSAFVQFDDFAFNKTWPIIGGNENIRFTERSKTVAIIPLEATNSGEEAQKDAR